MTTRQAQATRSGPACVACRTRRVGCNRVRPTCGRCREASRTCTYGSTRPPAAPEFQFIDETPYLAAGTGHPQVDRIPLPSVGVEPGSEQPMLMIPTSRLEEIETRLEMLTASVRAMQSAEYLSGPSGDRSASTNIPQRSGERSTDADASDTNETSSLGRLSLQSNGRARYVTGAFWANICDEATAIDELLREQTRYMGVAAATGIQNYNEPADNDGEMLESTNPDPTDGYPMFPFGDLITELDYWDVGPPQSSRYQRIMPDILPELPPKILCDHLFQCFETYYHVVAPVVHIPTMKLNFRTFWELDTSARRKGAAAYTPLIAAILFAGAASCDEATIFELCGIEKGRIMTSLHKLTAKTLRCVNFPRTPTLESFAAFMIIQNTCMREEQPLASCSYAGTVVRIAQMLGCNHDPSRHGIVDAIEVEVRRRISWSVFYIDTMIALAAGLPPLIDTDHWSVRAISELKDDLIGTPEGIAYDKDVQAGGSEPGRADIENSLITAYGIFAMGKYDASVVTRDILEKLYGGNPITAKVIVEVQEQLEKLTLNMNSRMVRLPQYTTTDVSDANLVFVNWTRLLLSAFADRNWTYLYHPLSRVKGGQNIDEILNHVLSCSRGYLEKIVALTCLEEFRPLQWSWPGIHQPLHAVMVLLRDVSQNPDSPTSELSRQVVDEVMALCGPDGGITGFHDGRADHRPLREGGQEVWNLIRKLRTQAWTKAGLDPDVLLTRDEIVKRVRTRLVAGQSVVHEATPAPALVVTGDIDIDLGDGFRNDVDPMAYLDENIDWLQWD